MRILLDHELPFALAHGGFQIQIEQTKEALTKIGLEVDYLRFWDADQKADLIHRFGRCSTGYLELARGKGIAVVMSDLLSETGSRSPMRLFTQKSIIRLAQTVMPGRFLSRMGWDSFKTANAVIALTPWEARLMADLFGADKNKLHVVPNGVEECFFTHTSADQREEWLISTVTITPRKRAVELAQAAIAGKVKIRIVGKPYSEREPYYDQFVKICQANPEYVDFSGPISDRGELARAYRKARGFVLLSMFESQSLSAGEAAAAGCPLLLTDLPWARTTFGRHAAYCPPAATAAEAGQILKNFSQNIATQPKPPPQLRWTEVAERLKVIYTAALTSSNEAASPQKSRKS
jgi:glycosyltransferase involved in cell wall biosynthesis